MNDTMSSETKQTAEIVAVVDMRPVPKGRPRVYHGRAITPGPTVRAEAMVRTQVMAQMCARGMTAIEGPVELSLSFEYAYPKSWAAWRRVPALHVSPPDLDNLVKLVQDALNGICWHDDREVAIVSARKMWAPRDGIMIHARRITEWQAQEAGGA